MWKNIGILLIISIISLNAIALQTNTPDAFSRVRFVQFEPIPSKNTVSSSSNHVPNYKELESKVTENYGRSSEYALGQEANTKFSDESDPYNNQVPKNYAFSYAIKDRNSGDDFSHSQAHNGQATKGEYRVKLPDGRIQVVTYTADNGGYRADIRYDKDELEEQPNNGVYITKGFFEENSPSPINKPPTTISKSLGNSFSPKLYNKGSAYNKKTFDSSSESPLLYFNEIRTFDAPSSTRKPASYETVENVDEEQFPYSKKLLADVNYLLKYVTPTMESKTENYQNTIDFSDDSKFFEGNRQHDEKFKQAASLPHTNTPYTLPTDFPYKFSHEIIPKGDAAYSADVSKSAEKLVFNEPIYKYVQLEDQRSTEDDSAAQKPNYEQLKVKKFNNDNAKQEPALGNLRYSEFQSTAIGSSSEEPKYNAQFSRENTPSFEGLVFPNSQQSEESYKSQSNFNYPQSEENNYNGPDSQTQGRVTSTLSPFKYDKSNYDFSSNETPKLRANNFVPSKPDTSQFVTPNYNAVAKFIPVTPAVIQQNGAEEEPKIQFAKIEIPQYIHIHRYEGSGEQSGDGRPKELIYYNPLQIPVANSVTYMERGNQNFSSPMYATFTPSYITMTEHPPSNHPTQIPSYLQNNLEGSNFAANLQNLTNLQKAYIQPTTPSTPASAEIEGGNFDHFIQDHSRKPPTSQFVKHDLPAAQQSHENQDNHENMIADLPFDPRTFSGYFDFLPSAEDEPEYSKPLNQPEVNYPSTPDYPSTPKPDLPQFYYDFSTASPNNKYVNSAEVSSKPFASGFNFDHLRNTSFRSAAYLRPLHKERVYIHHNSQPTTPSEDNFNGFPGTTISPSKRAKNAEVQIIKSISSTIPSELLKDFDDQLSTSAYASRSADNHNAGSERNNVRVVKIDSEPKLSKILVKKVQSALSTNGKVYLKSPLVQQKSTVR